MPLLQPPAPPAAAKNPLDEFDPNAAKPKHPFATYCPGRYNGGSFKVHSTRAHGLSALNFQHSGVLYEYENGLWVERARFESIQFRAENCDACGLSTMEHPQSRYHDRSTGRWETKIHYDRPRRNVIRQVFERNSHGKLVDPLKVLSLCPGCHSGMGY